MRQSYAPASQLWGSAVTHATSQLLTHRSFGAWSRCRSARPSAAPPHQTEYRWRPEASTRRTGASAHRTRRSNSRRKRRRRAPTQLFLCRKTACRRATGWRTSRAAAASCSRGYGPRAARPRRASPSSSGREPGRFARKGTRKSAAQWRERNEDFVAVGKHATCATRPPRSAHTPHATRPGGAGRFRVGLGFAPPRRYRYRHLIEAQG